MLVLLLEVVMMLISEVMNHDYNISSCDVMLLKSGNSVNNLFTICDGDSIYNDDNI